MSSKSLVEMAFLSEDSVADQILGLHFNGPVFAGNSAAARFKVDVSSMGMPA